MAATCQIRGLREFRASRSPTPSSSLYLGCVTSDTYWQSVCTGSCARVYQSGGDVSILLQYYMGRYYRTVVARTSISSSVLIFYTTSQYTCDVLVLGSRVYMYRTCIHVRTCTGQTGWVRHMAAQRQDSPSPPKIPPETAPVQESPMYTYTTVSGANQFSRDLARSVGNPTLLDS